jgi:formate/nitrite transporter FocA (FNT family)
MNKASTMTDTFNYTTIFAPLGFFIGGIFLVLLLNKFIGKSQNKKTS